MGIAIANLARRCQRFTWGLLSLSLWVSGALLPELGNPGRVQSAESLRLLVEGPLTLSISLDSLETFAQTGKTSGDLELLLSQFDEPTRELVRQGLQRRFPLSAIAVSHLTHAPIGEDLLQELGKVLQMPHRLNGFYGLRGAIVSAALKAPAEGWTLLDVMRQFPHPVMELDGPQLLALRKELTVYFHYNRAAIQAIETAAAQQAAASPVSVSWAALTEPGPYEFIQETLTIKNSALRETSAGLSVNYDFAVNVYLPQRPDPAAIAIISHGFGAVKENFRFLAEHLASHGYVVVVPDHVGSDLAFRKTFLAGRLNTILSPIEYLNRPREISFLIDELERLAAADSTWAKRLNLQQIGVYGDSLGGVTVLSLAGASLNFDRLHQQCHPTRLNLNASLYVQCRARYLPPTDYPLHDPRIKAAIAGHPLTSGLFGPEDLGKIRIPLLVAAGSNDIVAPVVSEQIHPFIWLGSSPKYLALLAPGTHWSTKPDSGEGAEAFPKFLRGEHQGVGSTYFKGLALAFLNAHLGDRVEYLPYLSASAAQTLSQGQPMTLSLIQSLTPEQLSAAYGKTPPLPVIPTPVAAPPPPRHEPVLAEIQRTGTLKIALRRDAPPFGYYDRQQQWSGYCHDFAIALQQHLTQTLDRELALELVQFPSTLGDRFTLVSSGTVHLECGPNTIRSGVPEIAFSQPIFVTGIRLLVAPGQTASVNPFTSLAGLKIGVLRHTTSEAFLRDRYPQAQVVVFDGPTAQGDAVRAVMGGELAAFAGDSILTLAELQQQEVPWESSPLIPPTPLSCEFYGAILPQDDPQWQAAVNGFIASQAASSVWNTWFNPETAVTLHELENCLNRRSDN